MARGVVTGKRRPMMIEGPPIKNPIARIKGVATVQMTASMMEPRGSGGA